MKRKDFLFFFGYLMMFSMIMTHHLGKKKDRDTINGWSSSISLNDSAKDRNQKNNQITRRMTATNPTIDNNRVFFYKDSSSVIKITFDTDVNKDDFISIIATKDKDIEAQKKIIEFIIETITEGDLLNYNLKFKEAPPSSINWGKYDTLEFLSSDSSILFSVSSFIIIDSNSFPNSFLEGYQTEYFITKKLQTIEVPFKQNIYEEYFAGSNPLLSITGYTLGIKLKVGNEKIMTITKPGENNYFIAEKLTLMRESSLGQALDPLDINLSLCERSYSPLSNVCTKCQNTDMYDFDEGTCVESCVSKLIYDGKECYTSCSQVVILPVVDPPKEAYKQGKECVEECSNVNGLDNDTKECLGIAITALSIDLYGNEVNQSFDIIFNVLVTETKVKGFALFALTGETESETKQMIPADNCSLDGPLSNVFKCTEFIKTSQGDYNMYWYKEGDSKSETGSKRITLVDIALINLHVVSISPEIIELKTSDTSFTFNIKYGGDFDKDNYLIALIDSVGAANTITDVITYTKPEVTITLPITFCLEGEYKIRTTDNQSEETPKTSLTSTKTITIYKAGLTIPNPISYITKGSTLAIIPIVFSSFLFKSRIVSVTYQKTDDKDPTLIDSAYYYLSKDGLTLNIDNDPSIITFDSENDYNFVIKLKTVTVNPPLTYTIKVFSYPKTVTYIDPIFEDIADNFIKITFDSEVIDPLIFKSIKTADKNNVITFTLSAFKERITGSPEPLTFDYKLLLNNSPTPPDVNKYIGGIQFYDTKDQVIESLLTKNSVLIVVKKAKYPQTIVPDTIDIEENVFVTKFQFDETETVYPEYFTSYDGQNAKIFIITPKTITLTYNETTKEITATNTEAITTDLELSSFGIIKNITITLICTIPKKNEDGECLLCSEINSELSYYNGGICIQICPDAYFDFVCYTDCPIIGGKQLYKKDDNECVITCPPGQTGQNKICVNTTIISIQSIKSPLYAKTDNTDIIITTDSVENYDGLFILEFEGEKTNITCTPEDGSTTTFKCLDNIFANAPAGNYVISWGKRLDGFSTHGYSFTIIEKSSEAITIELFTPEHSILPTEGNEELITLTYYDDFNTNASIELINVDTGATEPIPKDSIVKDVDTPKTIKIPIISTIPEGAYYIRTYADKMTIISKKYLTLYLKEEISLSINDNTYENGIELTDETITFQDVDSNPISVFPTRIQNVKLDNQELMYQIIEGNLVIQSIISVTMVSQEIKISYIPSSTPLVYTIKGKNPETSIVYPKKAEIKDKIYYHGKTSVYLIVDFKEVVSENIFNSIQTAEKNIKFTMKALDDKNMFKLILSDPSLSTTWGKYSSIKFYAKTKDDKERMIVESTGPFFILNTFNIPLTLLNKKIVVKTDDANLLFDLMFKETVEEAYINNKHLSLKENTICSIIYQSPHAVIKCTKKIDKNTVFVITSFDQEITFTVDVINCGSGMEDNNGCKTSCEGNKVLYNGECLDKCPNNKITEGNTCYDSCASLGDKQYLHVDDNICIIECPGYRYENAKRCYNNCPKKYNGLNIYIEGNDCVEQCPLNSVSNAENKCIQIAASNKCLNKDVNVKCITECPFGTYFSEEKKNCVSVLTVSDENVPSCKNVICKNSTGQCSLIEKKPVCPCSEGFFGSTCQYVKNDNKINEVITNEINKVFDKEEPMIDFSHPGVISSIAELTTILTQSSTVIEKAKEEDLIALSDKILNTLKTGNEGKTAQKEALPFLSFAISALIIKLNAMPNNLRQRLLTNVESIRDNLFDLIDTSLNTIGISELCQTNSESELNKLIVDESKKYSFQVYTSGSIPNAQEDNLISLEVSGIAPSSPYGIVKIDLKPEYVNAMGYSTTSTNQNLVKFALFDLNNKIAIDLSTKTGMYSSSIPTASLIGGIIDTEKQKYFLERGIDIYNITDEVFSNPCYYNWDLEYDLPQKYRYNELYGGKTIGSITGNCIYKGFDVEKNSIILECPIDANNKGLSLTMTEVVLPLPEDKAKVENLPTTCGGSIAEIANNFGFWTYLLVFIIGLIPTIIFGMFYFLSKTKDYIQGWIATDDITMAYTSTAVKTLSTTQFTENKTEANQDKSFVKMLLNNFLGVHPITTVCRGSVVTPLDLKISILMYNIFTIFGFNAIFYDEDMIGKKMEDEGRDNFAYPMKAEFHKIVYSLLVSMAFSMIVRAITLVTHKKKIELGEKLSNAQSLFEKYDICKAFWCGSLIQRIIAYVFMLGLSIFFFYYSVVFCGIYVNTQYGWFYSGLWSLFMDWVVFAPVSIVIITGVELVSPACGYYAKQLFWF